MFITIMSLAELPTFYMGIKFRSRQSRMKTTCTTHSTGKPGQNLVEKDFPAKGNGATDHLYPGPGAVVFRECRNSRSRTEIKDITDPGGGKHGFDLAAKKSGMKEIGPHYFIEHRVEATQVLACVVGPDRNFHLFS